MPRNSMRDIAALALVDVLLEQRAVWPLRDALREVSRCEWPMGQRPEMSLSGAGLAVTAEPRAGQSWQSAARVCATSAVRRLANLQAPRTRLWRASSESEAPKAFVARPPQPRGDAALCWMVSRLRITW